MGIIKERISQCKVWRQYLLIFITLGSREYQFDRLLKAIDDLIEENRLSEEIFAQIGQSNYEPKYYNYERYLSKDDFTKYQENATMIISHGGTGALVSALKLGKQVIAVPRLSKFGEHIDDHQLQVTEMLEKEGYLISVRNMDELDKAINTLKSNPINKRYDRPSNVIKIILEFIEADK